MGYETALLQSCDAIGKLVNDVVDDALRDDD
jgi:hypothetical protein